jgi:hypothetical protein
MAHPIIMAIDANFRAFMIPVLDPIRSPDSLPEQFVEYNYGLLGFVRIFAGA